VSSICRIPLSGANRLSRKKKEKKGNFLLKKTEVFLLSCAIESNMIYSDRAEFLDEMNRPHQRQQMAEVLLSLIKQQPS
jgi:hypothetical protein